MPEAIAPLTPLGEVVGKYGLDARKALGQHFLLDETICNRIALLPGDLTGRHVLEVGPGPGGLTRASSERLEACAGPTVADRMIPPTQNTALPPSRKKKIARALAIRMPSAATITAFAPKRSSSRPARIVDTPATRFNAMPNMMTSVALNPNDTAASTPPKAKTPASPSR